MGKKQNTSLGPKKENLHWTNSMDDVFIEAMLYEQRQGNRPDGTFTPTAYASMLTHLHEKLEMPHLSKPYLKYSIKTLKEHFSECYDMFGTGLSGFAWSPITKLFDAEEEVWKKLIQANPKAQKWRTKTMNNYDSLQELVAKDRATGDGSETAKEKKRRWEGENVTIDDIDEMVNQNEASLENFFDLDGVEFEPISPRAQSESVSTSKAKKKKNASDYAAEEDGLKSMMVNMLEVVKNQGEALINALVSSVPHVYSGTEIYNELVQMDVEPPLLDDAYFWLLEHQDKARALFGLPSERRKNVLQNMMNK